MLRTSIAAGTICLTALAACSTDEPASDASGEASSASSAAPGAPEGSESGAPDNGQPADPNAPGSAVGADSLSQPVRDATPPTIASKIMSCANSDLAMPIMFSGEQMNGYTCLLPTESGAVAMMTTAEDQAVVDRITNEAEGVEGYTPLDIPGMTAFRGVNRGTAFVMTVRPEQGIYQEFACGGVPNDQANSCLDEIVSGLNS